MWRHIDSAPLPALIKSREHLLADRLPPDPLDSEDQLPEVMHHLILAYLIHHGYQETAKALSSSLYPHHTWRDVVAFFGAKIEHIKDSEDEDDVLVRKQICSLIMSGEIDAAIEKTNFWYPSVLPNDSELMFRLKCRKFVEMIGECTRSGNVDCDTTDSEPEFTDADDDSFSTAKSDIDTVNCLSNKKHKPTLLDAMNYGRQLQKEFGNDPRPHINQTLHVC